MEQPDRPAEGGVTLPRLREPRSLGPAADSFRFARERQPQERPRRQAAGSAICLDAHRKASGPALRIVVPGVSGSHELGRVGPLRRVRGADDARRRRARSLCAPELQQRRRITGGGGGRCQAADARQPASDDLDEIDPPSHPALFLSPEQTGAVGATPWRPPCRVGSSRGTASGHPRPTPRGGLARRGPSQDGSRGSRLGGRATVC